MSKTKDERFMVRLTPDAMTWLRCRAAVAHRTPASMARHIIMQSIEKSQPCQAATICTLICAAPPAKESTA